MAAKIADGILHGGGRHDADFSNGVVVDVGKEWSWCWIGRGRDW